MLDAMDIAAQQTARPLYHGVTQVHNQAARPWPHPHPRRPIRWGPARSQDLQAAEHVREQGPTPGYSETKDYNHP